MSCLLKEVRHKDKRFCIYSQARQSVSLANNNVCSPFSFMVAVVDSLLKDGVIVCLCNIIKYNKAMPIAVRIMYRQRISTPDVILVQEEHHES